MPTSITLGSHSVLVPPVSKMGASHQVFALKTSKMIASHAVMTMVITRTLASHAVFTFKVSRITNQFDTFFQTERVIYARNTLTDVLTKLGTLLPGQTTLTDVSLADGFYNIEVRSSENFYEEARSRVRFPVEVVAGVISSQGIPNIQDLVAVLTNGFQTKLEWNIADVAFISGLKFGIWRSVSSPVVVTGPPDFETNAFEGLGKYSFIVTQTVDEFFAVAAISGSDQGAATEVFNAWDLSAPVSPSDQFWK